MNGWGCYAWCFGDGGRFLCDPEDEDVILEGVFP